MLKAGGIPYTSVDLEGINYIFMREASDQQLLQPDPFAKIIAEEFDVDIRIGSDTNTRSLMGIDPEKRIGGSFADNAAAAPGSQGDFLIAFQDFRLDENMDIYGSGWGNRVYLPLTTR